jgi:hypothetical protein
VSAEQQYYVRRWLEKLRRDASVVVRLDTAQAAQKWRAEIRRV